MRKEGRTVVVPIHKPIKPGTLRGLLDQAGVKVGEFVRALYRGKEKEKLTAKIRTAGESVAGEGREVLLR